MVTAACVSYIPDFQAALQADPLEVAAQLADTLELLDQCQARNVKPSEDFLDYVDSLLEQVDLMEIFGRVHPA